jgi:hypothetical protein
MKLILTLTAALIGGIALPATVFAGTTEAITGCATAPAEGSNFTVRVDPTCALGSNEGSGADGLLLAAVDAALDAVLPEEEEPAAE